MNQTSHRTKTDAGLATALRHAVGRLARRLRRQRADTSLSLSQSAALFTLARLGQLTPGALAEQEKIQPPSMTRIIAALEEKGLVRRTRHPHDGRQQLVELTPEGELLVRSERRRRDAWLETRLKALTAEEKETLRKAAEILDRLSQS